MDKTELIKNTYLFREIAANDLTALATIAEERDLMAGSLIYDAGQDSDAIFIIAMGTVDIVPQGKQAPFATMGSGQTFGELAFFRPDKRVASATVRERTQLVRIPFDKLAQLVTDRPAFGLIFYRNACTFLAKHVRGLALERNHRYF
ncbi:MAG: cyclic nucleotide-binding domain-containing protein [bacterium]|uniref:Cyclic nucleotide-binding domain-containing protein n=1 Tax=Candidatus Methylomirabilis tolerans TaxID=3123416 RepID=A0AAJ1ALM7_9BACT|nr:cyclic nucleotide-binding domain-containing protein [Candidatus Methylomirabilis sp.]